MEGVEEFVLGGDRWSLQIMWPEFDCVADDDRARFSCKDTIASVVLKCWSDVVAILRPVIPGATNGRLIVYEYLASRWCQRRGIEVERAE